MTTLYVGNTRRASAPWFKDTFGFEEGDFSDTKKQFKILDNNETKLLSIPNGREFHIGSFEVLSNEELKERERGMNISNKNNKQGLGRLTFSNIGGNVATLIKDSKNKDCVFQAASQFNCLEMIGPGVRPEDGITRYAFDRTQGPACALACPAGTLYRNYFVNKGKGQAGHGNQINTLDTIEEILETKYWNVQNGYAMPLSNTSMALLNERLIKEETLSQLIHGNLKVGIHWDTEVEKQKAWKKKVSDAKGKLGWIHSSDNNETFHKVCQVYVSACPVSYTRTNSTDWAPFAKIVLNSCYESTLQVASILATQRNERVKVYLTKVGGGAFGNRTQWIINAIKAAVQKFKHAPLDVCIVHYGDTTPRDYLALEKSISNILEIDAQTKHKKEVSDEKR